MCSNIANDTISLQDFKILKVLGQGCAGKVFLVEKIGGCDHGAYYAMKSIKKRQTTSRLLLERNILVNSNHPFVIKLFYAFQTKDKVYLVMEFHQAGDLFTHIMTSNAISEEDARVYLAEIILALDHIHSLGVIYRDLKLENVLVGKDGHLVLADFGLCGYPGISKDNSGTLNFKSPEVIKEETQTIAVDWWSLGVFMHVLLTKQTVFQAPEDRFTRLNIRFMDPEIPEWFSPVAKSLVLELLQKDPQKRLGSGGVKDIMAHPFFESVDWERIAEKMGKVPFVPTFNGASDLGHFESEFTSLPPKESESSNLEDERRVTLRDFYYIHPSVQKKIPSPPIKLEKSCPFAYTELANHHSYLKVKPIKRTLDSSNLENKENNTLPVSLKTIWKPYLDHSSVESIEIVCHNKKPKMEIPDFT